jgi:hypothetical protein
MQSATSYGDLRLDWRSGSMDWRLELELELELETGDLDMDISPRQSGRGVMEERERERERKQIRCNQIRSDQRNKSNEIRETKKQNTTAKHLPAITPESSRRAVEAVTGRLAG